MIFTPFLYYYNLNLPVLLKLKLYSNRVVNILHLFYLDEYSGNKVLCQGLIGLFFNGSGLTCFQIFRLKFTVAMLSVIKRRDLLRSDSK